RGLALRVGELAEVDWWHGLDPSSIENSGDEVLRVEGGPHRVLKQGSGDHRARRRPIDRIWIAVGVADRQRAVHREEATEVERTQVIPCELALVRDRPYSLAEMQPEARCRGMLGDDEPPPLALVLELRGGEIEADQRDVGRQMGVE